MSEREYDFTEYRVNSYINEADHRTTVERDGTRTGGLPLVVASFPTSPHSDQLITPLQVRVRPYVKRDGFTDWTVPPNTLVFSSPSAAHTSAKRPRLATHGVADVFSNWKGIIHLPDGHNPKIVLCGVSIEGIANAELAKQYPDAQGRFAILPFGVTTIFADMRYLPNVKFGDPLEWIPEEANLEWKPYPGFRTCIIQVYNPAREDRRFQPHAQNPRRVVPTYAGFAEQPKPEPIKTVSGSKLKEIADAQLGALGLHGFALNAFPFSPDASYQCDTIAPDGKPPAYQLFQMVLAGYVHSALGSVSDDADYKKAMDDTFVSVKADASLFNPTTTYEDVVARLHNADLVRDARIPAISGGITASKKHKLKKDAALEIIQKLRERFAGNHFMFQSLVREKPVDFGIAESTSVTFADRRLNPERQNPGTNIHTDVYGYRKKERCFGTFVEMDGNMIRVLFNPALAM